MVEQTRYLFVYGTLRRDAGHPMAERLSGDSAFVSAACLPGQLFDAGQYPAAIPQCEAGEVIRGELYELDEPDKVWPWLDEYEGYFPGNEGDSLFVRRLAMVTRDEGRPAYAWVYWYNRPVDRLARIEGGRYE